MKGASFIPMGGRPSLENDCGSFSQDERSLDPRLGSRAWSSSSAGISAHIASSREGCRGRRGGVGEEGLGAGLSAGRRQPAGDKATFFFLEGVKAQGGFGGLFFFLKTEK